MRTLAGVSSSTSTGSMSPSGAAAWVPSGSQAAKNGSWGASTWSAPVGEQAKLKAMPFLPRGSCMGTSWPFTCIAKGSAAGPMRSAAALTPSAIRSPKPSRRAICSTSATMASALPQVSSNPPVSSLVRMPFS